jgi:hypothetical protein
MSSVLAPPHSYAADSGPPEFEATTGDGEVLPSYADLTGVSAPRTSEGRTAHLKDYTFETEKKKGKPFVVMTLTADAALSPTMPSFLEGQAVRGKVKFIVDKPESFQHIVVDVQGKLVRVAVWGADDKPFIHLSRTLWSEAMGDPREVVTAYSPTPGGSPQRSPDASTPDAVPKFSGKFPEGEYVWEFSLDIPREVTLEGDAKEQVVFRTPQTCMEERTGVSIVYEAVAKVSSNSLFRTFDSVRVDATFGYIPLIRPPPFPPLRALAYEQASPLLPPFIDPDGWHAMAPVTIRGKVFSVRTVQMECTLFLSKPLSYTRSTVIPLYLRLSSSDSQALDLLSSPKAITCHLRRRLKLRGLKDSLIDASVWRENAEYSQPAVWWNDKDDGSDEKAREGTKYLSGELHLVRNLKPTSAVPSFRIDYSVVLLPFKIAGFEGEGSEQLLEQPVEIVTAYAPGPHSKNFTPPGELFMRPVDPVRYGVGYNEFGAF